LAEVNSSLMWWTSELSTRNHFSTKAPVQLFQLLRLSELAKSPDTKKIIIYRMTSAQQLCLIKTLIGKEQKIIGAKRGLRLRAIAGSFWFSLRGQFSLQVKTCFLLARWLVVKLLVPKKEREQFLQSASHVAIKTFLLPQNLDKSSGFVDPYFQPLCDYLADKGVSFFSLVQVNRGFIKAIWRLREWRLNTVFPIEYFIRFRDIIEMWLRATAYHPKIHQQKFNGIPVRRFLLDDFLRTRISIIQSLHFSAARVVAQLKLERVVMTYEGRGWENAFVKGLKLDSGSTPITGYQHTVVLQSAMAYYPGDAERAIKPFPDRILTSGRVNHDLMIRHGSYPKGMVQIGCALRMRNLDSLNANVSRKNRGVILLALEGVPQMSRLLRYCIREFVRQHDRQLVIRAHPEMPIRKYETVIQALINSTDWIRVSENSSLDEDLEDADICIYWGSTVAFHAIAKAIPLINFAPSAPLAFDPLFQLKSFKWTVGPEADLHKAIDQIYALSEDQFIEQYERALSYLKEYFCPFSKDKIETLLS